MSSKGKNHLIFPSLLIDDSFFSEDKENDETFMKIYDLSHFHFKSRKSHNKDNGIDSVYQCLKEKKDDLKASNSGILIEGTIHISLSCIFDSKYYETLSGLVQTFNDFNCFLETYDMALYSNKDDPSEKSTIINESLFNSFKYYPRICDKIDESGLEANNSKNYTKKELFRRSKCHFLGYGLSVSEKTGEYNNLKSIGHAPKKMSLSDENSSRVIGEILCKSSGDVIYNFVSDILVSDLFKDGVLKKGRSEQKKKADSKCSGLEEIYDSSSDIKSLMIDFASHHIVFVNRLQLCDLIRSKASGKFDDKILDSFISACFLLCDNLSFSLNVVSKPNYLSDIDFDNDSDRSIMFNLEGSDLFSNCPLKTIFLIIGMAWKNLINTNSIFEDPVYNEESTCEGIIKLSNFMCKYIGNVEYNDNEKYSKSLKILLNCLTFVRCSHCESAAKINKLCGIRKDKSRNLSNSFVRKFKSDNENMKNYNAILFKNKVRKNSDRAFQIASWKQKLSELCYRKELISNGKMHLYVPDEDNCKKQLEECVDKHLSVYGSIIVWPMIAFFRLMNDDKCNGFSSSSSDSINNNNIDFDIKTINDFDTNKNIKINDKNLLLDDDSELLESKTNNVSSSSSSSSSSNFAPSLSSSKSRKTKKSRKNNANPSKDKRGISDNSYLKPLIDQNKVMIEMMIEQQKSMFSLLKEIKQSLPQQSSTLIENISEKFRDHTTQLLDKVKKNDEERENIAMNFIDNLCEGSKRKRKRSHDSDDELLSENPEQNATLPKRKSKPVQRYDYDTSCEDDFTDNDVVDDDDSSDSFNLSLNDDSDSDFEVTGAPLESENDDNDDILNSSSSDDDDDDDGVINLLSDGTVDIDIKDDRGVSNINKEDYSKTDPSSRNFSSSSSSSKKISVKDHIYSENKIIDNPKRGVFVFNNSDFENQFIFGDDDDDDDDDRIDKKTKEIKRDVLDRFTRCEMGGCCLSEFPKDNQSGGDDDEDDDYKNRLFPQSKPYGYILPSNEEDMDVLWDDYKKKDKNNTLFKGHKLISSKKEMKEKFIEIRNLHKILGEASDDKLSSELRSSIRKLLNEMLINPEKEGTSFTSQNRVCYECSVFFRNSLKNLPKSMIKERIENRLKMSKSFLKNLSAGDEQEQISKTAEIAKQRFEILMKIMPSPLSDRTFDFFSECCLECGFCFYSRNKTITSGKSAVKRPTLISMNLDYSKLGSDSHSILKKAGIRLEKVKCYVEIKKQSKSIGGSFCDIDCFDEFCRKSTQF